MDGAISTTPFWRYLRDTLADRNLTMTELGRLSGVKTQAIYKWKQAQPSVASVRRIARALGLDSRGLLVLAGHVDEHELGDARQATEYDVEAAIMASRLFTPAQKAALIETARAFAASNGHQSMIRSAE